MPDAEPEAPLVWLDRVTLRAMEEAVNRALAWERTAKAAADAAREVARAHHPAVTMPMLAEAVAAVLPDPEGLAPAPLSWKGEPLREAAPEEVASSLAYAMRFDETGKARRTGHEYAAHLAARHLAAHLALANFVVMRRPPVKRHGQPARNPHCPSRVRRSSWRRAAPRRPGRPVPSARAGGFSGWARLGAPDRTSGRAAESGAGFRRRARNKSSGCRFHEKCGPADPRVPLRAAPALPHFAAISYH